MGFVNLSRNWLEVLKLGLLLSLPEKFTESSVNWANISPISISSKICFLDLIYLNLQARLCFTSFLYPNESKRNHFESYFPET